MRSEQQAGKPGAAPDQGVRPGARPRRGTAFVRGLRHRAAGPGLTALCVLVLLIAFAPLLSFIEVRALDLLFALRPGPPVSAPVALIDIGEDAAAYARLRDPRDSADDGCEIPRRAYAEAVRRLHRWGARVIVFDLMFRRSCPYEDRDVARVFRAAGNVIVAATSKTRPGAVGLQDPVSPYDRAAWGIGSPVAHQPNEAVRTIPLLVRDRDTGKEYPALSLVAYERYLGTQPARVRLDGDRWLQVDRTRIPLLSGERISLAPFGPAGADADAGGMDAIDVVSGSNVRLVPGLRSWNALLINWAGPQNTIKPRFLGDVLAIDDEAEGRRLYADKAVVIGRVEWDAHWTAVGAMPGPEIQANALATLLSGHFLRPVSTAAMLLLLALLALATVLLVKRLHGIAEAAGVLALLLAVLGLALVLLVRSGIWLYLFYAELAILLAWGMTTVAESGKMTAMLARFVPAFIGKPETQRLGEVRDLHTTILYSDIRDYTTTAERLSAQDTLAMLKVYHSAVEDIIAKYGGTIVKTPGDAILAVFWHDQGGRSHAACALQAGREILTDIPVEARTTEGATVEVGIGINAGVVAIGLVGKHHLEPTVIGDAVNVAARLEGLTKTMGFPLIYSESVRQLIGMDRESESLGEVTVKGKEEPIRVYGIACQADAVPRAE